MKTKSTQRLLATTALVAVTSFSTHAYALDFDGTVVTTSSAVTATSGANAVNDGGLSGVAGNSAIVYTAGSVTGTVAHNVTGGAGGVGATNTTADATAAGIGGAGGQGVTANGQASPTLTINTGVAATGGAGGAGGASSGAAAAEDGGAGGAGGAGILANGTTLNTVTISGTATVTGGNGGAGGASGSGTGGAGGASGAGVNVSTNTNIAFGSTGTGVISGGTGAAAVNGGAAGTNGAGILISGASRTLNITGNTGATVRGGASGAGIGLSVTGANATITNGSASGNGVTIGGSSHAGDAVNLGASTTAFTNWGTVQASGSGNALDTSGFTLGTLTNNSSITSVANAIQAAGANSIITNLINNTGATISSAANAINVSGAASTIGGTTFTNAGTISGTGASGIAINVGANGNLGATITNTGGTITSANTSQTAGTIAIGADIGATTFTGGTISNTASSGGNGGNVFYIGTSQTGIFTTSSTITAGGSSADAASNNAFLFASGINGDVTNSGTITGKITETAAGTGNNALINSGTITGAINLAAGTNSLNNSGTVTGAYTGEGGADSLTNSGTLTGNVALGAGANSVTSSTGGTLTGTITGGANVDTINLNGGTLTGAIDLGAGSNVFNAAGGTLGSGSTINFGANTSALNVNENFSTNGAITTGTAVTTGVATGKTFTVANTSTLGTGVLTLTGTGTTKVNTGTTLTAASDTFTSAANGKYIFEVSQATILGSSAVNVAAVAAGSTNGRLILTGAESAINQASNVQINVAGGNPLINNSVFRIVSGGGAETTAFDGTQQATDNSFAYDFFLVRGTDASLNLTDDTTSEIFARASNVAATQLASSGIEAPAAANGSALATVLNSAAPTGVLGAISGNIAAASTAGSYIAATEKALPTVDAGASNSAFINVNGVNKVIGGQLASGSETAGKHLWLKGYGSTADQDKVDGIAGYEADTFGAVLGADRKFLGDTATLGLALSYGNISVDSDNAARTNTDIDAYQASIYGDKKFGNNYFVEGIVSYGLQQIDSQRVNIDGVGTNANADYDANVYSARAQIGRDFAVGSKGKFTPSLISQYAAFDSEKYTETGAGTANLTVDTGLVQRLDLGVGMRYSADLRRESGALLRPSVNVNYIYDVLDDEVSSNSTFQGGGGSFAVRGANFEQGRFQAGLGLDYYQTGNWQFSGRYDFEGNDEYQSHGASLRASYNF